MQAVVEKENRTMGATDLGLIPAADGGQDISMVAVGWTQLLVWGGLVIAAL
jgi:hypothetical protein